MKPHRNRRLTEGNVLDSRYSSLKLGSDTFSYNTIMNFS